MCKILYIHGFATSPNSHKAVFLRQYTKEHNLPQALTPAVPVEPERAANLLQELATVEKVNLIIGSSLGGFYALILAKRLKTKTVLLNPALEPWKTLSQAVGLVKRHNSEDFFFWKEEYVAQLESLGNELSFDSEEQRNLKFYLANDDLILKHDKLPELFPESEIKFYDNCQHTCSRLKEFMDEILHFCQ